MKQTSKAFSLTGGLFDKNAKILATRNTGCSFTRQSYSFLPNNMVYFENFYEFCIL